MLIQKQYEDSEKQINDLNAQVAYLQMMSIKEEV
jgi:cbb3-type cytochrome oxidase cytochrome c subunit